ncbi:MAG: DUF4956 domain-containing protein [Bacteroidales bacterium]|nr:DUF4956 domain-containing protein [Bacteroidales bacterium]
MKIFKILIVFAFCTFAGLSNYNKIIAQDSSEIATEEVWEQSSLDELVVNDTLSQSEKEQVEAEKKKKKDKDIIKLNGEFFINLLINVGSVLLIIFLIYYPRNKKLGYIFTFILFNIVIFMLTYVLNEVKISMGAAFGLFAVFSMLRYRTAGISMKDMTYLFVFIALGLISAISLDYWELCVINGILIVTIFLLDSNWILKQETTRSIEYDNLVMIKPENREALIEDLKNRTGFNIHRVVIGKVNLLKDCTTIKVYFYE